MAKPVTLSVERHSEAKFSRAKLHS